MSTADKSEKSTSVYVNRCFEDPINEKEPTCFLENASVNFD